MDTLILQDQIEFTTVEQLKECLNKLIKQAIHDIQSPLASLLMLGMANKTAKLNPNHLKARIDGILNSIAHPFKDKSDKTNMDQIIVVPDLIEKIIAEKECEYTNLPITFKSNIDKCTNDISIIGNINDFSRMLSNLINNAVEVCTNKSSSIAINCEYDNTSLVKITIEDNGLGMPETIKSKILNNEHATSKDDSHGLGFTHTRETLAKSDGKLDIESKLGYGTKIILTLPFANKLPNNNISNTNLTENPNMTLVDKSSVDIVIVEDDEFHGDTLAKYMFKGRKADIFNSAKEFLANFDKYPHDTTMLIDYQFPEENINGIDIYKEVYLKGFRNCYLYTGMEFDEGELPTHVKVILKTNLEALKNLIND